MTGSTNVDVNERPRKRRSILKRLTIGGVVAVILMLSSLAMQLDLPKPTGPHSVGRTYFRWTDRSRPEVMTDLPEDVRCVPAVIWYPAEPGTGRWASYIQTFDQLSPALLASGELEAYQVLGMRFVRSHSRAGARPLGGDSAFPVLILSPGHGTNVEFYASLAEDLASHGYIVVGVNHPFDVAAVEVADGRIISFFREDQPIEFERHERLVAERVKVRERDILFVVDELARLNADKTQPLANRLDLKRLAAGGHSLGAIAAAGACRLDTRITACVNLDGLQRGGPFSTDAKIGAPPQPFLFLSKDLRPPDRADAAMQSCPAGGTLVVVHGARHDSFSDGQVMQPTLLPMSNASDRHMSLIRRYLRAFLDQTLRSTPSSILQIEVNDPAVSVRHFGPNK